MLMIVNVDPYNDQSGWVDLDLDRSASTGHGRIRPTTCLPTNGTSGAEVEVFVRLSPRDMPAHILKIRRHMRTEQDFDYFM